MPRLIIHIGSQKTGSTSLQTFLTQNPDRLRAAGLSYVKAGRGPAAHNKIAVKRDTPKFDEIMRQMVREIEADRGVTHVISSEMLFSNRMADGLAEHLPQDLRHETRIIAYVRRQDRFLEAMYKQVVKTGRFTGSPGAYLDKRDGALAYGKVLDAYAAQFGHANVVVLPYETARFPGGNVILDVAPHLGLGQIEPSDLPAKFSNITLSREVSEMLGLISRTTDINIAELIRVIIRNAPEGAFYAGDSYTAAECRQIVDRYAADNEHVRATFRPDLAQLFDCSDLEGDLAAAEVPAEERLLRLRQAQEAVFTAIGQSHRTTGQPASAA